MLNFASIPKKACFPGIKVIPIYITGGHQKTFHFITITTTGQIKYKVTIKARQRRLLFSQTHGT